MQLFRDRVWFGGRKAAESKPSPSRVNRARGESESSLDGGSIRSMGSNPVSQEFFARTMRLSDLEIVARNEELVHTHPWSKRIFIDCLRAGYQCWVLANKSSIIAHGVMSVAIGECHLLTLVVHPEYQRRGFARKLLNLLLDRARKQDATECFLEARVSNAPAIALYESIGFVKIGERKGYYPGGPSGAGAAAGNTGREDAIIMSCRLDSITR